MKRNEASIEQDDDKSELFKVIAGILQLGNTDFKAATIMGGEGSEVKNPADSIDIACKNFGLGNSKAS